jgi:hypothetical protein
MRNFRRAFLSSFALSAALTPATFGADSVAQIYDQQIRALDHDILPLAEAMPADKYDFVPKAGAFQGVRTFAEQTRHLATVIYMLSGAVLEEKPPVDIGKDDNGPSNVRTKAQLVEYLRGALAFAHKAVGTLTEKNEMDDVSVFGERMKKLAAASEITWHSFDHFGQMVVYARMNGVIPPSSLPSPAKK